MNKEKILPVRLDLQPPVKAESPERHLPMAAPARLSAPMPAPDLSEDNTHSPIRRLVIAGWRGGIGGSRVRGPRRWPICDGRPVGPRPPAGRFFPLAGLG